MWFERLGIKGVQKRKNSFKLIEDLKILLEPLENGTKSILVMPTLVLRS